MNIEFQGLLYRGTDPCRPDEIWNYSAKMWVTYRDAPWPTGKCGVEIDEARAEALKFNNVHAEHFMYYDFPPWRQPLSQTYYEAMMTDPIRAAIARRKAELGRS